MKAELDIYDAVALYGRCTEKAEEIGLRIIPEKTTRSFNIFDAGDSDEPIRRSLKLEVIENWLDGYETCLNQRRETT